MPPVSPSSLSPPDPPCLPPYFTSKPLSRLPCISVQTTFNPRGNKRNAEQRVDKYAKKQSLVWLLLGRVGVGGVGSERVKKVAGFGVKLRDGV